MNTWNLIEIHMKKKALNKLDLHYRLTTTYGENNIPVYNTFIKRFGNVEPTFTEFLQMAYILDINVKDIQNVFNTFSHTLNVKYNYDCFHGSSNFSDKEYREEYIKKHSQFYNEGCIGLIEDISPYATYIRFVTINLKIDTAYVEVFKLDSKLHFDSVESCIQVRGFSDFIKNYNIDFSNIEQVELSELIFYMTKYSKLSSVMFSEEELKTVVDNYDKHLNWGDGVIAEIPGEVVVENISEQTILNLLSKSDTDHERELELTNLLRSKNSSVLLTIKALGGTFTISYLEKLDSPNIFNPGFDIVFKVEGFYHLKNCTGFLFDSNNDDLGELNYILLRARLAKIVRDSYEYFNKTGIVKKEESLSYYK